MTATVETRHASTQPVLRILTDEGFRLFFPLAALYAALWPFQWVLVFRLDLPFVRATPPALWHAHEMIFGAFGAALIGFITTAVPEWTDTPRPQGRSLLILAVLWGIGRGVGFLGADITGEIGAIADLSWLFALVGYMIYLSVAKRTDRLLPFIGWVFGLALCEIAIRYGFMMEDGVLAGQMLQIAGLAFLGLLGVALARITVPITNLVLDPAKSTSPFRPHPGRINLAPGLIVAAIAVELMGFSPETRGYMLIAAGAAFMDRVGEAFIGREGIRAEIILLAGSSAFAGIGLLLNGATMLGAPLPQLAGVHLSLMGGLGMGVLAVFCIAGLLHTNRPLGLGSLAKLSMVFLTAAVLLRVLPDIGFIPQPPGPPYAFAAACWAAAFLSWLKAYWPLVSVLEERHGPLD